VNDYPTTSFYSKVRIAAEEARLRGLFLENFGGPKKVTGKGCRGYDPAHAATSCASSPSMAIASLNAVM
jgi:hypothetical protein